MRQKAQRIGKQAENLVDMALRQSDCWWSATWPEVIIFKRGAKVTGKAMPDRLCFYNGKAYVFEIKTWEAKDRHRLTKRIHQYHQMVDITPHLLDNGKCFYLVWWRWKGVEEWRLHSLDNLAEVNGGVTFNRDEGLQVTCNGDLPLWWKDIEND